MGCVTSKRFHSHLHFSLKSKTSQFSDKEEKLSSKSSDDRPQTSAANTVSSVRKIVEEDGEEDDDELEGEEIEKAICQSMDPKSSAMAKLLALLSESHVQTDVDINSHQIAVVDEDDDEEEEEEEDEEEEDTSSDRQKPIIASTPSHHQALIKNNSNIKEEGVITEKSLHKKKAKARRQRRRQQQEPSFEFKTVGSLKEWLGVGGQMFSPPGSFHTPKFGGNNSANLEVKDVQN